MADLDAVQVNTENAYAKGTMETRRRQKEAERTERPNKFELDAEYRHIVRDKVLLFSASGKEVPPFSPDGTERIRVVGTFPNRAEAVEHAELVQEAGDKCSLYAGAVGEWIPVPKGEADTEEAKAARVRRIVEANAAATAVSREEFEALVREKRFGWEGREWEGSGGEEEEEEDRPSAAGSRGRTHKLRASCSLAGQTFALCSVLSHEGEGIFCVYGTFETVDAADKYARNVLSQVVQDVDIHTVSVGSWFALRDGVTAESVVYRDPELNNVMQYREKEKHMKAEYKVWEAEKAERDAEKAEGERERAGKGDVEGDVEIMEE